MSYVLQAVQHVQANPDVVCPAGWRPGDRCATVLQAAAVSRQLCMHSQTYSANTLLLKLSVPVHNSTEVRGLHSRLESRRQVRDTGCAGSSCQPCAVHAIRTHHSADILLLSCGSGHLGKFMGMHSRLEARRQVTLLWEDDTCSQ
jgi:hypothetical protein